MAAMYQRDYRNIVSGLLLIIGGLAIALYAGLSYPLGTLRQMGPGLFPTALGCLLAIFGAFLFVPALFRPGDFPKVDGRSTVAVLAGVGVFAVLINPFGLIVAIVASTGVSSLADVRVTPKMVVVLSAVLSLLAYLIFKLTLGLPVAMFRWPL